MSRFNFICAGIALRLLPHILSKGKHYPLAVMLDALSVYNLGYGLEETCRIVNLRSNNKKATSSEVALTDAVDSRSTDTKISLSPLNNVVNSGGEPENRTLSLSGRIGYRSSSNTSQIDSPPKSILTHINLLNLQPSTLSNWLAEFKDNLPYLRLREFALKRYEPKDMVMTSTLAHRQLYPVTSSLKILPKYYKATHIKKPRPPVSILVTGCTAKEIL